MDLVARLHRHMRRRGADYQVRFVPDPMCWTEAPSDLRSLARQRARWQKGLLDVLWSNRDMLFRSRYGRIGCFAFPYLWLFELFAPIMETLGIATIVLAAALNILSREFFLQFLIFGYAFATVISIGSVLQEEITYKRYNDWKDVVRLVSYCSLNCSDHPPPNPSRSPVSLTVLKGSAQPALKAYSCARQSRQFHWWRTKLREVTYAATL